MTDIWHEPTETPVEHKTLLFDSIEFDETEMGVYSGSLFHSYNEFEPMTPAGLSRWAYLSDFINCQKELDRTRKALDVANEKLRHCVNITVEELDELKGNLLIAWDALSHFSKDPIANNALKKITALEQKDVK